MTPADALRAAADQLAELRDADPRAPDVLRELRGLLARMLEQLDEVLAPSSSSG